MTAQIIQLRDHQSPAERERARKALEEHINQQAIEIANQAFPSVFGFPEQAPYMADERDPA